LFLDRMLNPALPKTAQVYDMMRRAIVGLELRPGEPVNEKLICEQLGISRTPLREAILQLHAERLVEPQGVPQLREVLGARVLPEHLQHRVAWNDVDQHKNHRKNEPQGG